VLTSLMLGGKTRDVLLHADKNGFYPEAKTEPRLREENPS